MVDNCVDGTSPFTLLSCYTDFCYDLFDLCNLIYVKIKILLSHCSYQDDLNPML